ncbi:lipoprotein-releasing ABC transporter permease subunit LolC [Candidatus Curculioniphilus buchneri]|uniref:lipoprotein-releasing ABC transporter permease subunit LolC n=1 Tax=Candidatus Curculioniphilus buchneri TaxID=690594 RepID=UPI00376F0C91
MYQPIVLYIGFRYMRGRTLDHFGCFISWLSRIGITLGVMALVIVLSVMNGLERELKNNILKFIPHALLTNATERLNIQCIPRLLPETLSGVVQASPLITSDIVLQSANGIAIGMMLGVNLTDPEPLWHYLLDARKNDLLAGQYRVILGNELAIQLKVTRGDQIRLMVPNANQVTPIGLIPNQRLFIVAGTFSTRNEVDNYQILVNQHDAACLMNYAIGEITGWRLWLKKPLEVDQIKRVQFIPDGLVWKDWRDCKGALFKAIQMEKNMMGLLLSLIVGVAVFNIFTFLGLLVIDKKAEVAILKTQGMTRKQVLQIFIVQGTVTGIIGAFLGSLLGIILTIYLNQLMPVGVFFDGAILPVEVHTKQIIIIMLSVITASLLSTLYPSWHASSMQPAKELRHA